MIISINGNMGSGKTTLAKKLSERLGWNYYSMGELRREAARKRGITLAEYNKLGESDISTDLEVDKFQQELGEKNDNFVIDGRTSWYFIHNSLKIFLDVDEKVGAQRVWHNIQNSTIRNEDKNLYSLNDVLISIRKRKKSDIFRYKKYFNIKVYNIKNYDLVIDTSKLKKNETFKIAYNFIKEKLKY